jgi:hypothetical protein
MRTAEYLKTDDFSVVLRAFSELLRRAHLTGDGLLLLSLAHHHFLPDRLAASAAVFNSGRHALGKSVPVPFLLDIAALPGGTAVVDSLRAGGSMSLLMGA